MNLRNSRGRALAIASGHALLFLALAWWSWRKWPDPLIDFGRELYAPWQITRGKLLYRDIASLFGPLSPYLNALWFRLFGVSMMTLAFCNLAIFAAVVAGIHRLVRDATDWATAAAASAATLLLFGFCQYTEVGNYNFVCPYSHEATHGLALSVAMLLCVRRALGTRRAVFWALAGILFGAILLTKPELSLSAAASIIVASVAAAKLGLSDRRVLIRGLALFASGGALVPFAFFVYFLFHVPASDALRAIGGAWITLFVGGITENTFYRTGAGLDAPFANFLRLLAVSGGIVAVVAAAIAASSTWMRTASRSVWLHVAMGLGVFFASIRLIPWGLVPRALPLLVLAALVALIVRARDTARDGERGAAVVALIAWAAFALVLLAKIALNARLAHYGFYLALPATTVAIVLFGWAIPSAVDTRWAWASSRGFRAVALWVLGGAIAAHLAASETVYVRKALPIGAGGDRFYALTAPGAVVADALSHLQRVATPTSTLAVLPEGVMLNYLLRRDSPLRVVNLMPPELLAFGEDDVLRSLEAAPPDFVVLAPKDMREYGYPMFGSDARYGRRVLDWVNARYRRSVVIRRDPSPTSGPGIEIYALRASPGGHDRPD